MIPPLWPPHPGFGTVVVKSTLQTLAVCGLLLAGTVGYVTYDQNSTKPAASGPLLIVDAADLNLGELHPGEESQWTITLRNNSSVDLRIEKLSASCQCTSIIPESLTISPAGIATVVLKATPPMPSVTEDISRFEMTLTAKLSTPDGVQDLLTWELSGTISSPLKFSHSRVFFSELDNWLPTTRFQSKTLTFTSQETLESVTVSVEPPVVSVKSVLTSPTTGELVLEPVITEAGPFECELSVTGISTKGEKLRAVIVPVAGTVVGDVHAVPDKIVFEPEAVGHGESISVALQSHTKTPFQITDIQCSSPQTVVEPVADQPEGMQVFRVRHLIGQIGVKSETITLEVVLEGEPVPQEIRIPLTVIGRAADPQN